MKKQIFVDTLFITALVNQRDTYHKEAIRLVKQLANQPLLTTDAVLLEVGNALSRHHKPQAVEIIEQFIDAEDIDIVPLSSILFEQAFSLYKTYQDKSWGLVDCISFVVMRKKGITQALTIDQHFVQAGFQILMQPPPYNP
jgi:uncharacterized protein